MANAIHEHWKLFLVEGIILVILGIAAILVPPIATLAFTIVIGWLFLISGVVGLFTTFYMRSAPGFWWSLFSAVIAIARRRACCCAGRSPGRCRSTFVLIAFFVIEGIVTIMYAIDHRAQLSSRWGWMLASGVVDLILAGIIFAGLPGTAAWALGLVGRHQYGVRRHRHDRHGAGGEGGGLVCRVGKIVEAVPRGQCAISILPTPFCLTARNAHPTE